MNEFIVTVNTQKKSVRFSGNTIIYVDNKEYNQELYHLSGNTYLLKLKTMIRLLGLHCRKKLPS